MTEKYITMHGKTMHDFENTPNTYMILYNIAPRPLHIPYPIRYIPVFCVVPLCVGWRPVVHGTPTHAEWPMRLFSCFMSPGGSVFGELKIPAVREVQNEVS